MNELLELFELFGGSVNALSAALKGIEQAEQRCRALEETLLAATDFLIQLDRDMLSHEQRRTCDALVQGALLLLSKDAPCSVST